jgi:hypothetical protein
MLAPSSDWFVGASGLSLIENGQWVEELIVPLFAYDAGTDSGGSYTAPNSDTNPQARIGILQELPFVVVDLGELPKPPAGQKKFCISALSGRVNFRHQSRFATRLSHTFDAWSRQAITLPKPKVTAVCYSYQARKMR